MCVASFPGADSINRSVRLSPPPPFPDVAGGSGELAFELCNLNGTPATVLEPRPLELHKRIKWLLVRGGRQN